MPEEPTYDFVYLDADKTGYPAYYDLILPRLVPGGLLLIDNVLLRGDVVDPQDDRSRLDRRPQQPHHRRRRGSTPSWRSSPTGSRSSAAR